IQALDLAGRKVARNGGQSAAAFVAEVREWLAGVADQPALAEVKAPLENALALLEEGTATLLTQAGNDPDAVNALAVEYLDLFGLVTYAWLWARMMLVAAGRDDKLGQGKQVVGRFFFERLLPRAETLLKQMQAGSRTMMTLAAEDF